MEDKGLIYIIRNKRHKDIIFPRVSDILTSKVEDENVL